MTEDSFLSHFAYKCVAPATNLQSLTPFPPGKLLFLAVFRYSVLIGNVKLSKANRSGDACHRKDSLLQLPEEGACHALPRGVGGARGEVPGGPGDRERGEMRTGAFTMVPTGRHSLAG